MPAKSFLAQFSVSDLHLVAIVMEEDKPLRGPISKQRLKADLIAIALALKIPFDPETIKHAPLVSLIKDFIKENQEHIASQPKLQGLIAYGANSAGRGKGRTKHGGKTSAHKAAEDEKEAQQLAKEPTGCVPPVV